MFHNFRSTIEQDAQRFGSDARPSEPDARPSDPGARLTDPSVALLAPFVDQVVRYFGQLVVGSLQVNCERVLLRVYVWFRHNHVPCANVS